MIKTMIPHGVTARPAAARAVPVPARGPREELAKRGFAGKSDDKRGERPAPVPANPMAPNPSQKPYAGAIATIVRRADYGDAAAALICMIVLRKGGGM